MELKHFTDFRHYNIRLLPLHHWILMHFHKHSGSLSKEKQPLSFYVYHIGVGEAYLSMSSCSTGGLWNFIQMDGAFCKKPIQHHATENLAIKAIIALRVNRHQSADNCWQQEKAKAKKTNKQKTLPASSWLKEYSIFIGKKQGQPL